MRWGAAGLAWVLLSSPSLGCAEPANPAAPLPEPTRHDELPPSASVVAPSTVSSPELDAGAMIPPPEEEQLVGDGPYDLWIRGGTVVDGTGGPLRLTDVVVHEGRIVHVGKVSPGTLAERVIEAEGLVVTPGFIDAHAHGGALGETRNFAAMGVTTIVLGQDGQTPGGKSFASWVASVARGRPMLNVVGLSGHATLRTTAGARVGKPADGDTIDKMRRALEADLAAGAAGLSLGLEYQPGRSADLAELEGLALSVAEGDGLIMSHLRSEDDEAIEDALNELLAAGNKGARVHVAHIKVVYGKGAARAKTLLEQLARARASGVAVTADLYPYNASYTTIGIVFPDFAMPPHSYQQVRKDSRDRLGTYLRKRVALRNGPGATLFATGKFAGMTLEQASNKLNKPFEDVLIDDIGPSGGSAAFFVMDEDLQTTLLKDPFVMIGSDGSSTTGHPRGYGTFAKILSDYVRRDQTLELAEAVRKMASLPAETLRLVDRGVLRKGAVADILVFDLSKVEATATFEKPHQLSSGFNYVFVNGVAVRDDGEWRAARPGAFVRPQRAKPMK